MYYFLQFRLMAPETTKAAERLCQNGLASGSGRALFSVRLAKSWNRTLQPGLAD
jgi:hypothetical protein